MLSNRLAKHFGAAAAAAVVVGSANAAIVHWADANLTIPNTIDGLYINVETRATGSSGGSTAGWDINPYSSTSLTFFNASGAGVFRLPGATSPSNVPVGTMIDSTGAYAGGAASTSSAVGAWVLNGSNYFGFRFVAADGGTKYGWGRFVIGAALNGADRMIAELAYEDSGAGIMAGAVPAPGAVALLGLAGLAGRRRR
jgi:MYXO-CTERM domain-containing protein